VLIPAALAALSLLPAQPADAPKFEIKDGDRIVWIGGTLVEREQRYGYWETALHAAFPDKKFTLRNFGWSGDTVWGEARGRFDHDKPDVYFKQLVDQTLALKPTVIFVSYGTNESFAGEAGLPRFEKGLEKLLDALKPANARVVLFSPIPVEEGVNPSSDQSRQQALARYSEVIRTIARKRGAFLADLNKTGTVAFLAAKSAVPPSRLTENGMHLTEDGYREFAVTSFPLALQLENTGEADRTRLEPLRKAIVAKNELFFYRWRPQNETYLFGFRKHEQGKNAREVAEFDPLVAKAEEDIEKLRQELK
jgi:lysophospholipase L1-like esterase